MKRLMGAALVAGALVVAGPAAISPVASAPQAKAQSAGTSDATDFSAHRYVRRHYRHYGYSRPHYRPYYYNRPVYYRPYPYSRAGAVHLRHRVWSGLVVSVHNFGQPQISFALSLVLSPARSSLRSAHSWRVHVPVSNFTLGATAKKRDGDQPQSG